MIATLREQFRELLAAASLREESAVFYEDLCRLVLRQVAELNRRRIGRVARTRPVITRDQIAVESHLCRRHAGPCSQQPKLCIR